MKDPADRPTPQPECTPEPTESTQEPPAHLNAPNPTPTPTANAQPHSDEDAEPLPPGWRPEWRKPKKRRGSKTSSPEETHKQEKGASVRAPIMGVTVGEPVNVTPTVNDAASDDVTQDVSPHGPANSAKTSDHPTSERARVPLCRLAAHALVTGTPWSEIAPLVGKKSVSTARDMTQWPEWAAVYAEVKARYDGETEASARATLRRIAGSGTGTEADRVQTTAANALLQHASRLAGAKVRLEVENVTKEPPDEALRRVEAMMQSIHERHSRGILPPGADVEAQGNE